MKDGERLKQFIDNQHRSKVSIAAGLGITKQTLYQYFKTHTFSDETKRRFEQYFGKQIFTGNYAPNGSIESTAEDEQPAYKSDKDMLIAALQEQIKELREDKADLKKLIQKLQVSLDELLEDHTVIRAQIKAASRVAAERFAGNDQKKLDEELRKLDILVGEFSK